MPGLLRGVARTAVIAGTATAVSNGVSRRQVSRWDKKAQEEQAAQPQAAAQPVAAPAPAATPEDDMSAKVDALQKLATLKDQGILNS
jgi:transposase-like protein